ncbi:MULTISPECIES: ADP-ribosylglycohydrolase family protein [unclassified Cryobacterium]|uniref:ADP-ribosylglycohydrolase family protein n=1 Tax=unclassified Cryobacterium TaxID=2649013 RepID=UPI00106D1B8E|nr:MULTISPECIES: ADP-ribosylglycohydrolase family protein [unclassified Cryobacterium]TFC50029.1 ADP-ribosylglycohydrolase family protein [Cryobacterium sp. TMB3-1-2]TFC66265.1 ADP-ribosylglycohydrolase family protein [Cryobacterium sp. TMB3-15]TFC78416.1 ADP-ribosylglycohydrolase family protein [Cryobacterium sp. TMB3-10]TFC88951.1 ADP-ribosylglycohydrolase family protein [Cryobacterium sp. TMT4-31]TFD44473.1 ADP-ribosylglycohydrolase family protein [Cryobacterium sp. TMB3-12]
MKLSSAQHDRSAAVLLGMACGDALGAGYAYAGPLPPTAVVGVRGGAGTTWARGEWTDYTALAVPVARAVADGLDLRQESTLDLITAEWVDWADTAPYAGNQLDAALSGPDRTAAAVRAAARARHDRVGRSAGNGCLLRTAPVALAFLHDPDGLADAARRLSELTHCETDAGDACVLWGLAIRHTVLTGELDLRVGLGTLSPGRRELWSARINHAERRQPRDFTRNGWVVQAVQGAWSAIVHTRDEPGATADAGQYRLGIEAAVRGGGNTDAVAGIAGALLAAQWGLAAVPSEWRRLVQGWPGLRGADLVRLSVLAAHSQDTNEAGERESFRLHAVK